MEVFLHSPTHPHTFVKALTRIHGSNLDYLYDIKILLSPEDATESMGSTCQAQVINTHKIILAASSKWFYQLTLDGTLNCTEILIPGMDVVAMKLLIEFMYTGSLHFTSKNVISLFNTATKLEMVDAVELCKQFMSMLSEMPQSASVSEDYVKKQDSTHLRSLLTPEVNSNLLMPIKGDSTALSTVDDVPQPDCGRAIKVECLSDCETEMEVDASQAEINLPVLKVESESESTIESELDVEPEAGPEKCVAKPVITKKNFYKSVYTVKSCQQCKIKFKYHHEAIAHRKEHFQGYMGYPVKRTQIYRNVQALPTYDSYLCKKCNGYYRYYSTCLLHVRKCINGRYICADCKRKFVTKKSLRVHRISHKTSDIQLFKCQLCSKKFKHATVLFNHAWNTHSNVFGKFSVVQPHPVVDTFQCHECGESLPDQYMYKRHMNSHVASKSLLKDVQISDSEKKLDTGPVSEQMANNDRLLRFTMAPEKRLTLGSQRELAMIQRLSSHGWLTLHRKRLRCFEVTTDAERQTMCAEFNGLSNKNQQDSMIASLITIITVKQRRPCKSEKKCAFRNHSYTYSFEVDRDGVGVSVPVCLPAVMSMLGISKARVERIRESLAKTGQPPIDQRGKHKRQNLTPKKNEYSSVRSSRSTLDSCKETLTQLSTAQSSLEELAAKLQCDLSLLHLLYQGKVDTIKELYGLGAYVCSDCVIPYAHISSLALHMSKKHNIDVMDNPILKNLPKQNRYFCKEEDCKAAYPRMPLMTDHMKTAHPSVSHMCDQCDFKTVYQPHLNKHIMETHNGRMCKHCSHKFANTEKRMIHEAITHHDVSTLLTPFSCPEPGCLHVTYTEQALMHHYTIHIKGKSMICQICAPPANAFKTRVNLDNHLRNVHGLKQNEFLGIVVTDMAQFIQSLEKTGRDVEDIENITLEGEPDDQKDGTSVFICEECGTTYNSNVALSIHKAKSHLVSNQSSKKEKYRCNVCDYRASSFQTLSNHKLRKHGEMSPGIRAYNCTDCSYLSYTEPHLREHIQLRHKPKVIQCPKCIKQFKSANQLSDHMRITHPKYKYACPFCHYSSASKSAVHKHVIAMHTHPDLQPYKCAYCSFTHIHAGSIHAHCKGKHKEKTPKSIQLCPLPKVTEPLRKIFLDENSGAENTQPLIMEEVTDVKAHNVPEIVVQYTSAD